MDFKCCRKDLNPRKEERRSGDEAPSLRMNTVLSEDPTSKTTLSGAGNT